MFSRILIANRGEIACRIIRTARRLGVATVAIYSDADIDARHVALADEAFRIGPAPAPESYLSAEAIIEAARRSGAEGIHPGYGFLAESADFAESVVGAGFTFIGPTPEALRAIGLKSEARRLASEAGIPVLPAFDRDERNPEELRRAAEAVGYPLLIKPNAGGGGKGMKVVEKEQDLAAALDSARRAAAAAFGDDRLILEQYLADPRHVEVQVFADRHGRVVHLFERDCSLQRRHQKIIEEAPAPGLDPSLREILAESALRLAERVGYRGAGTVEFLLDGSGRFYFMEMNARLQVEHPVTEMITDRDLVEWQLLVASGSPLPCTQEEIAASGHAIEARIYAEDPRREFQPTSGTLIRWRPPDQSPLLRIDTGIEEGDQIRLDYDPLLAKLIVRDRSRDRALQRLQAALADIRLAGVATNLEFLLHLCRSAPFRDGRIDTGLVAREVASPEYGKAQLPEPVLALTALAALLHRRAHGSAQAAAGNDPHSPWQLRDGWRPGADRDQRIELQWQEETMLVRAAADGDGAYSLQLPQTAMSVRGRLEPNGDLVAEVDGRRMRAATVRDENGLTLQVEGCTYRFHAPRPGPAAGDEGPSDGALKAPMPGKIVAVEVVPGDRVEKGALLVAVEAMKMEQSVIAPFAGRIAEIHCRVGEAVGEGAELLRLEADEGEQS